MAIFGFSTSSNSNPNPTKGIPINLQQGSISSQVIRIFLFRECLLYLIVQSISAILCYCHIITCGSQHASKNSFKSNPRYTLAITPKRVTSSGVHLRGLAPGQHSFEETSQLWRAVDDTASDLIGLEIEAQNSFIENNG